MTVFYIIAYLVIGLVGSAGYMVISERVFDHDPWEEEALFGGLFWPVVVVICALVLVWWLLIAGFEWAIDKAETKFGS